MIIAGPAVARKPLRHTLGLRVTTPFRGMFAQRRYELYLTDPRAERRKTRWQVELSILLAGP